MSSRARVLVLNSALGPLDYRVPQGMAVEPGSIVIAPLGPRQLLGVVWEPERMPSDAEVGDNRLRPLLGVADAPPLPTPLRRLIEWTADYYLAPPAAVVRMALSSTSALEGARTVTEYRVTGHVPDRLTPQRAQALERIGDRQGLIRELATMADVSDAVIRGLVKNGAIEGVEVDIDSPFPLPDPDHHRPTLSDDQRAAADILVAGVAARSFQPVLLDGVTGSGKTEVYFEAVAQAVAEGRQVLVLLPEIALTEPFLKRFHDRFGCEPVAWHSGLRSSQRRRAWRAIASGQGMVTVGARSALFLPYANLGLIVVDEAHETSFKQEDGVHYHARDVAVMRGLFEPCPVILASATPAIETRQQVALGRYTEVKLPGRFGPAQMPTIEAIDLIQDPPERGRWIAPKLVAAMKQVLEKREQSLLYLNRRGYAPLTLCRTCGHRFQCPNCTAWMVEHRLVRRLACHHCGHVMPTPRACPECGGEDSLVACGPGVERIADEATALFPEAKIAVVTSDTIWSPAKAAEFVGRMEAGDIDIVVGTQLITKGYHFPNLTLVGVIDADLGLDGGDLRAAERTFQQIRQVSGRAGRGAKPGHVFIQTHSPKAQVMQALVTGDAEAFYAAETEARRDADAPPFGRYAAIIISSEDQGAAQSTAAMIARAAPKVEGMHVFGPAPAPLAMLRGRHRFRLLVHARRALAVQDVIREWLGGVEWSAKVRVAVDVDPYSFL
ncbi:MULTISPECIES: primosomal protein N' [unclassified Sphingomonas]|uniref:primosomal protein N' n=1 Tax=unclassified Sphingomonas TaxID=196159 RepID=UPI0028597E23|nr:MULTISPECIES: primosomal protein N' [unclassified Sphingomonas]MDR6115039.1 primosomal protein N' (replication factor Y) [Sphingomonas sp. SORGH_AS_0789]MDR6151287.1 primosomal protein N' (replication factor Y) [Sphingomonas sp. SORGH_AS_0742]